MFIFADTYITTPFSDGTAAITREIDLGQVKELNFSVGVGLSGYDFTVTLVTQPKHYDIIKGYVVGYIKDDNGTPIVFGVCSKVSIDEKKQETVLEFSGINRMLRGIYLPSNDLTYNSGGTVGELAYSITASSKLGVLKNIIKKAYNMRGYMGFPFKWDTPTQTGTAYVYNVYAGDFKVLADVVSDYIERENVPAYRWTFTQNNINAPTLSVSQIATQTASLKLATKAIKDISTLQYDISNCAGTALFVTQTMDSNNIEKYDTVTEYTLAPFMPLQAAITGHDNVVETETKRAYCRERIAQKPAVSITVTCDQYTTAPYSETFNPSNIGKIVSFPYNANGNIRYLYGVVTLAEYEDNSTVKLTLSNVQLQETDVLDVATMSQQTATPKTTLNLLNTLSNNLGSQTVKPKS